MSRSINQHAISSHDRAGLTLIELVVVLAILATLGTVMVVQSDGLADQARYEQSARTLETIRDAVIGREVMTGEDPTSVAPGFVADVGRLPRAGAAEDMSELWDIDASGTAPTRFALQNLDDFDADDLWIACGWRGPYVRLPIGSSELRDGWGRSLVLSDTGGGDVSDGELIGAVASGGSGIGDSFDVNMDDVVFESTVPSELVNQAAGDVTLRLVFVEPSTPSPEYYAVVRLYGPVDGAAGVSAQSAVLTFDPIADPTLTQTVTFTDVPIGPKLMRAYQLSTNTPPSTTAGDADADLTGQPKSDEVRRVTVIAEGGMWTDLVLEGQ